MAINKVEANGETLIDLTSDTATANDVIEGKTLHLASGAVATGTYRPSDEIEARLRATVGHSSKNLLDMTKYTTQAGISNIQINEDTGSLSFTGTGSWRSVSYLVNDNLGLKPNGTTYILTCINNLANSSSGRLAIRRRDTNGIIYSAYLSTTGKKELKFTASSETFPNGWYISILATGSTSTTSSIDISNLMLREASIADDTFEPYITPTDEAKQDKPVVLYDAGKSSAGKMEISGLSNLTQYSELHITLFAPANGDNPNGGFTHTIIHPFIFPDIPNSQVTCFDCRVAVVESGTVKYKQIGLAALIMNTNVQIVEFDENANFINIPSNHYIYIKRIVGIP